ncbi:hypothetical protein ACIQCF_07625 [Streptomyces sp. NPDC088353]|uniref:hypothetical protein n=1 Tax=Streptomyces sp. NPDC088353 TaxID=3365855 RepID=UPI00380E8B39
MSTDVFGAIGAGTVLLDSGATGFAPELREALIGLLGTVAESGHTLVPAPEDPPTNCRGCGGTGQRYDGTGPDGHVWSGESCCCSHEHCSCGACAFPCELASYAVEVAKELVSFAAMRAGEGPSQAADTAEVYPGELATYRQLVRTLRADVRPDDADVNQVRERLHQHAAADIVAREEAKGKSTADSGDATPDFFRPGHTYSDPNGWKFRVDTITTHPEDGERTALGWRYWTGWEPYAYGEGDWEIGQAIGWTDVTEGGAAR